MASPQLSAFMRLPPEVRNMIYVYSLVVEGCITPYKEVFTRIASQEHTSQDFAVGLLAVDKVIRSEAAAIFYGKNIWRITTRKVYVDHGIVYAQSCTPDEDFTPMWIIHAALFRKVLIRADRYDTVGFDSPNSHYLNSRVNPKIPPTKRMKIAHANNFDLMQYYWGTLFGLVLEMPNLVSVTFDVSSLLCLTGCCRLKLLREFFLYFSDCWEDYLQNDGPSRMMEGLKAAYVVGLKNAMEEDQTIKTGRDIPEVPWVILTGDRLIGGEEDEEEELEDDEEEEEAEETEDPDDD